MSQKMKENYYQKIDQVIKNTKGFNPKQLTIRDVGILASIVEKETGISYFRMDMGVPGLKTPQIGVDAQIKALTADKTAQYVSFAGIDELKESAALFVEKFLNKKIGKENFIPTIGAMHGCSIAIEIIGRRKKEKDTIVMLDPDFSLYKMHAKKNGINLVTINKFGLSGDQLIDTIEETVSRYPVSGIIWSSPNNPTWQILSDYELKKLAKILDQHDIIAIEDNAYFGFDSRFPEYLDPDNEKIVPSIINYSDRYIALFSGSKIFSYAGERAGIALIAPALSGMYSPDLESLYKRNSLLECFVQGGLYSTIASAPQSVQYGFSALLKASADGSFSIFEHLKPYVERAVCLKKLFIQYGFEILFEKDQFGELADGFYFTVSHPAYEDGNQLLLDLMKCGLTAVPLNIFGFSEKAGLRICTSFVTMEMMDELEDRLKIFKDKI